MKNKEWYYYDVKKGRYQLTDKAPKKAVESIKEFQDSEEAYAKEVAEAISAKLFISKGSSDLEKAIEFIKAC